MVRKAEVEDRLYMDEAEGFLLTHALFSPPRTWPPLPPEQPTQAERLQRGAKKMNWDGQIAPDAPVTGVGIAGPSTSPKQRKTSMNAGAAQAGMGDWFEIEPLENGAVVAGGSRHDGYDEAEDGQERCVICLMALRDRTVVGVCGHEFCFECIGVWANQSRRCPLCSADMAPFLLHDLNNPIPTKFYLPPLPTRKFPPLTLTLGPSAAGPSRRVMSNQEGDTPSGADQEEADELDKQVERRREIYRHGLFVKHIPSNPSTGFRPNPTPRQIADTPVLLQRATAFLRRELRIWGLADVEFLLTYVLNLLKAIDLRSEPFIRLLRDVLEPDTLTTMADGDGRHRDRERGEMRQYPNAAEHLAHELHSWLRSPFKELWRWDALAQYDPVPEPKDPRTTSSRAARPTSTSLPVTSDRVNTTAAPGRSISLSRSPSPARSRSRSSSFSSYSSRSPSPHSPRDPTRRDTFLAAPIAGERRWDEPDTWISPSHLKELEVQRKKREKREAKREAQRARWDERVKRRLEEKDAEMREREEKRARYAQEPGQWQGQGQGQMVGRNGLPIPVAVPIRAIHGHGQLGMRAWGREAGTGVELLPDTPAPSALVARHGSDDHGDMQSPAQTTDRGGLAIKGRSSFGQAEAPTRKLTLAERLAKAKADRAGLGWQPDIATDRESGQAARPLREVSGNLPANPADITVEDLLFASPTNEEHDIAPTGHTAAPSTQDVPTTQPHTGETVLERIARARQRLRLRLKLESERACLRHNIAESKAQTLRAKLLEAKIARQAGETDTQLRKMDKLERDKEVRRRLMVAKMMSAETEGERRARELKERLARAKKGVFGRGAVANAGAMRGADMGHGVAGVVQGPEAVQDEGYWEGMGADPLYSVNTYETDVPVLEYDANPDQPQQEYATEAAGTAEPSEPAKTPAAPAVTKQKTAEEKAKEEARRAKILRNLLLERKRAKAASGPETAAASLAGEVVTAAATATEAEAITATPASQPTVEGDEAAVEEVVDIVEEDEWDFEPGAVL